MEILNSISSFEEKQKEEENKKEKRLKNLFANIFLHLDIYSDRQVFLWLDKKADHKYKVKYSLDNSVDNKFLIKKSSELDIRKIYRFTMDSEELKHAINANLNTDEVVHNSIIHNRIKKQFIDLAKKENIEITGSFISPSKIIFYINTKETDV